MLTGSGKAMDASLERGFTYLAVLVIVAIMGILLAAGGQVWQQAAQREKEKELLFVGNQFRQAIGLYYQRSPGTAKAYPKHLEDMLLDQRYPAKQRYLRKIFRDPMTGEAKWGLVQEPGGGFTGVYSLGQGEPLKKSDFRPADQAFEGSSSYADWRFVYIPQR
jgi:type II secretory pathway pseudopilin PulG